MWNQTQTFQEAFGCYTSEYMDTSVQNLIICCLKFQIAI